MSNDDYEGQIPELPELPDLDSMLVQANSRLIHFERIKNDAEKEIASVMDFIKRLGGKPPKMSSSSNSKNRTIHEATYLAILVQLGNRNYAGASTLASSCGVSDSTASLAMKEARERGHARLERRGRKYRWYITDAGAEFASAPKEDQDA